MGDLLSGFLVVLLLSFSLFMFIAGIFTTYFGAGKSRKIGIGLAIIGILTGAFTYIAFYGPLRPDSCGTFLSFIIPPIVHVIAAIIGAGAALLVFLGAIMKA